MLMIVSILCFVMEFQAGTVHTASMVKVRGLQCGTVICYFVLDFAIVESWGDDLLTGFMFHFF